MPAMSDGSPPSRCWSPALNQFQTWADFTAPWEHDLKAGLYWLQAALLTVDAVKGHLARGRAHLQEINTHSRPLPDARAASAAVARYVALFNQRDWEGLRALLADALR
jgi:hypothetical protein